jgi:hypothetical protein
MSFRRYEIVLPTRYNDGAPVGAEKIDRVLQEVSSRFGGTTFHPELAGLLALRSPAIRRGERSAGCGREDTPENTEFFATYKETLKQRFRQIDIWIVSYEIMIT